jgi:hypothetical protein
MEVDAALKLPGQAAFADLNQRSLHMVQDAWKLIQSKVAELEADRGR